MPDYKELYLKMVRASEAATRILIQAQRDCEELFLADGQPTLPVFPEKELTGSPQKHGPRHDAP